MVIDDNPLGVTGFIGQAAKAAPGAPALQGLDYPVVKRLSSCSTDGPSPWGLPWIQRGASMASWIFQSKSRGGRAPASGSGAGHRRPCCQGRQGLPSLATIVAMSVCRVRLPGSRQLGWLGSREK
jgi:hypothetical protein